LVTKLVSLPIYKIMNMSKIRMNGRKTTNKRVYTKLMFSEVKEESYIYIKTVRLIDKELIELAKNNPPVRFNLKKNILYTEIALNIESAQMLYLLLEKELNIFNAKAVINTAS